MAANWTEKCFVCINTGINSQTAALDQVQNNSFHVWFQSLWWAWWQQDCSLLLNYGTCSSVLRGSVKQEMFANHQRALLQIKSEILILLNQVLWIFTEDWPKWGHLWVLPGMKKDSKIFVIKVLKNCSDLSLFNFKLLHKHGLSCTRDIWKL